MIHQIKSPQPIPATLPHGPLQQASEQPDAVAELYTDADSNCALLTKQSTEILLALMGWRKGRGPS